MTQLVEYVENANGRQETLHGFKFTNENGYSVWLDTELWTYGYHYYSTEYAPGLRTTKSFTLKPGESYVWRCGREMQIGDSDYSKYYYVKYKAYKKE